MDFLINMNRRLRIAILFSLFLLFVPLAAIFNSILISMISLSFLGLLIYTNIKYDKIQNENTINFFKKSLDDYNFNYTESHLTFDALNGIAIDPSKEKIVIMSRNDKKSEFNFDVINFEDIIESTIVEDNVTITKTSKGGLIGGAAIGGMVAGGIGAVVGSMAGNKTSSDSVLSLTLSIVVNDLNNPIHEVKFLHITSPIKKDTPFYYGIRNDITKWHKIISVILKRNELKTI